MQISFTCLVHKYIFLGKPDYIHNQLKRRCILKQIRTSDDIILESKTLFMDLLIAHSLPLFLAYGTSYRMTYVRSNPCIISGRN